jgi:hypothetical protein
MPQDRTGNGFIGSSCCLKPGHFTVFVAAAEAEVPAIRQMRLVTAAATA